MSSGCNKCCNKRDTSCNKCCNKRDTSCNECEPWGSPGPKGDKGDPGDCVLVRETVIVTEAEPECDVAIVDIDPKAKSLIIKAVGGGGSGSGEITNINDTTGGTSGGGSGYIELYVNLIESTETYTDVIITLGEGGSSVGSNTAGNNGTNTEIRLVGTSNDLIGTAEGGKGGTLDFKVPGKGGEGTVTGVQGYVIIGDNGTPPINQVGGSGGSSHLGPGGIPDEQGLFGGGGGGMNAESEGSGKGGDGKVIVQSLW